MAELAEPPKRAHLLAQLERVCQLHRTLVTRLAENPTAVQSFEYQDAARQTQKMVLDESFIRGLVRIRRTLIAECHDQGFLDEMAQILQRYLNP